MNKRFIQRMELIAADPELPQPIMHGPADAKIGFISYGGTLGPITEGMQRLDAEGIKTKFMELRTLWPFPGEQVREFVDSCDTVFVAGVLGRLAAQGPRPARVHRTDGQAQADDSLRRPLDVANWVVNKVKENM